MTKTAKTSWKNRFTRFLRSSGGNVSLMFGLSAAPLMMAAAAAIEFASLSGADTGMQAAADSAALAGASAYGANNPQYATIATNYLKDNAPKDWIDPASLKTDVKVNSSNQTITVSWTADAKLSVGKILGADSVKVGSSSTVALPIFSDFKKGEIAMVVDYSWSMNSYVDSVRKYISMRNEATKLINALTQNGVNDDVKIGLVPFSENVRVSMPRNYYNGQTSGGTWTKCIWDRYYPYNRQATTPTSSNSTKWNYTDNCSAGYSTNNVTLRPLTTDHVGTLAQFNSMYPIGNTHIALGMEMAYHMLTPEAPLTQAVPLTTPDTLKAVVLLTDGEQTTEGYGSSNSLSVSNANANLTALCAAMKNQGIRVVTVSFDLADTTYSAAENRLRDCASGPEYYFNTETNAELADAFGVIRSQLARNMYVSK